MKDISFLIEALTFSHKFENIIRKSPIKGKSADQSDAEHSFELAFICLMIIDKFGLSLSKEKVMYYALFHDLVEVYSSDIVPYNVSSQEKVLSKADNERLAMERIISEFPEFSTMNEFLSKYEQKEDPESNFVYVIDKVLPVLNTEIAENNFYSENNVTFEDFRSWITGKVAKATTIDSQVKELIEDVVEHFAHKEGFFYLEVKE